MQPPRQNSRSLQPGPRGDVLLGGFVSSDGDLLDAMRIDRKAAGNRRVVDSLSIELGGRKSSARRRQWQPLARRAELNSIFARRSRVI